MESRVEQKILGLLDVIALEVTGLRSEVTGLRSEVTGLRSDVTGLRSDVTGLRSDVTGLRNEMVEFRAETKANFNRIERRIDNHELRIGALEQPPV